MIALILYVAVMVFFLAAFWKVFTKAGEPVKLTAQEYKLLSYLMHHKGKVISRTELIEHIYDQDFDRDSNTIEVFVTRIRKKLGQDVITTIRGLGYSLEDPNS